MHKVHILIISNVLVNLVITLSAKGPEKLI